MKRIINLAVLTAVALCASSCLSDYDNYDGPNATLQGTITDLAGNPLNIGSGDGARIKLLDYGYSQNPKEQYLKVKMDGTYINTKIFSSTYDVIAEGPFVPLLQVDDEGKVIVDKTQKQVKVKGTTTVDFSVEPFLYVTWEGEPSFDAGRMTVSFKVVRGTDDEAWHKDLRDVALFVSTTQYVGENNYDQRISVKKSDSANDMLDTVASLTTLETYPMLPGHTYYIRVGARIDYASNFGENYPYNYTPVKKVTVPQY